MPGFTDPFIGNVPKQMSKNELVRAILLNIAAELEAVHVYTSHADATDDKDARMVLLDIAAEELVHAGEFTSLLYRLDPLSAQKAQEGFAEVQDLLSGKMSAGEEPSDKSEPPVPQGFTVGSLLDIE